MPDAWTAERHAAAKARCEAARKGPWQAREWGYAGSAGWEVWVPSESNPGTYIKVADCHHPFSGDREYESVNACFIAAARTDLPDVLAAIGRVLALADAMEAAQHDGEGWALLDPEAAADAIRAVVRGEPRA